MRFLAPLIPTLDDTPANFLVKLNQLQDTPLRELNNLRAQHGLPMLGLSELLNSKARVNLYGSEVTQDTRTVVPLGGSTGGASSLSPSQGNGWETGDSMIDSLLSEQF